MKTLYIFIFTLSGVYTQGRNYGVFYPVNPVCAVRGSSVYLPCNYSFPGAVHVTQQLWCSMNSNTDVCQNPPYVYNSLLNNDSNYQFIGDDKLNCTLLILNVQFNYSGVYKFRFITNNNRFTGTPGVTLQVTDVKMSLIRLSGNGTLKQGDSLNLTCDVNCTHTSSQFTWTKDDQRLPESGTVLHFPALTAKDSGKYTCTWETDQTSGYDTISLHVEEFKQEGNWIIIIISVVVVVVVVVMLVIGAALMFYKRKHSKAVEENSKTIEEKSQQKPQRSNVPQACDETPYEEEVTYASVFVKDKNLTQGCVHAERQKEDSVIYSIVTHTRTPDVTLTSPPNVHHHT